MARFENKHMTRTYDKETGKDIFTTERGNQYDLSELRFLAAGIDTIRQLYNCTIKNEIVQSLASHYDKATTDVITLGGIEWKFTASGKKSGYQYILKNLDEGFVILLKSFYKEIDEHGPHLKIEATPQIIDDLGICGLSKRLREVAQIFGDTIEASGVAVHLYADMKGLDIPEDFEQRLATRSKKNFKVNTISNAHFEAAEAAFVYGQGQTYLFGQSSSLQMCLYDKTQECIKSDKLDFMDEIWKRTPSVKDWLQPEYDDGKTTGEPDTVHRLEFRIHHRVIKEFENGHYQKTCQYDDNGNLTQPGEEIFIREARDLKKHLQGLWLYCLENFRLEHSRTYVDPIWQKLMEDIRYFDIHPTFIYARAQKKSGGPSTRRNVAMWIGNHLRLAARRGLTPQHVTNYLMQAGLESEIADYFGLRIFGHQDEVWLCLHDFVANKLREHRLNGVAA